MSDASAPTPDLIPSVAETARRARFGRIDLLGGPLVLYSVLGLLGLVLVVDTFLLPMVVSFFSPPRQFFDLCYDYQNWSLDTPGPSGRSGLFAIALFGLVVLCLSGLKSLAPRSIFWSWAFLAVILALQYGIGRSGNDLAAGNLTFFLQTVGDYLENSAALKFVDGLVFGADANISILGDIPCGLSSAGLGAGGGDPVNLSSALLALYNPLERPDVASNFVSPDFTQMLATNLAVLAIFAVIIWGAVILNLIRRAVGRLFRRSTAPQPRDEGRIYGWYQLNGPEKSIAILAAVLTLVAAMAGPLLILFTDDPLNLTTAVHDLLWIGPLFLLLDLARVAFFLPQETLEQASASARQVPKPERILPSVLGAVEQALGKQLIDRFTLSGTATDAELSNGAAVQSDFGADYPIPENGDLVFFEETLTDWHYDLIVEILNRKVWDAGLSALLICPQEALADIQSGLSKSLKMNPGEGVVKVWTVDEPTPPINMTTDLIIATAESLESLVARAGSFDAELASLGAVVALNVSRMDMGLLFVQLRRLEQRVGGQSRLISIVQSEYRNLLHNVLKNMPLIGRNNVVRNNRAAVSKLNERIDQHLAVLVPSPNEELSVSDLKNWPIALRAAIAAQKADRRATPYFFDIGASFVSHIWDSKVVTALAADRASTAVDWARKAAHPVMSPLNAKHPVAVIADQGNLWNALSVEIGTPYATEALRLIVAGTYPGAMFMINRFSRLLEGGKNETRIKQELNSSQTALASFISQPSYGPVELVLSIQQEFFNAAVGAWLTQRRLEEIWEKGRPALKHFGINISQAGLNRLFKIVLGIRDPDAMVVEAKLCGNRVWEYKLNTMAANNAALLTQLRLDKGSGARQAADAAGGPTLPLADHGLSYVKKTRFVLMGNIYKVNAVHQADRALSVSVDEAREVRPYAFVRDYAILTAKDDPSGFAAENYFGFGNVKAPYEVASGYLQVARRTRAAIEYAGRASAFVGENPPESDAADATSPVRLRSVAMIQIGATPNESAIRQIRVAFGRRATQTQHISKEKIFTLKTTLQDVLAMCFPEHAHRVVVVCPEAESFPVNAGHDLASRIQSFALDRQPWLVPLDEQKANARSPANRTAGLTSDHKAALADLCRRFFEIARAEMNAHPIEASPRLGLIVIEDSDHDLGVAKAMSDRDTFAKILALWCDFLGYCASTKDPARNDYAFGSGKIAECYDFGGALEIVRSMRGGGRG